MSQFPTPDRTQWAAEAEKALKGAPLDGLTRTDADGLKTDPLYAADGAGPALFAPRRQDADGRAWDIRSLVEGDEAEALRADILTELENGAASVLLRGAVLTDPVALSRALDGVALELAATALDAGFDGPAAADALALAAKGSPRAKLDFHLDPISTFAEAGGSPRAIADHVHEAAEAAARHAAAYPQAGLFLASGRTAHEAGGSWAQSLGFAAASAVAYVQAAVQAGVPLARAVEGVTLGLAVDAEYFDALCQVRALRLIWRSLSRALGHEAPARIEARSSRRMLSARDPWPNLLRLTAAGFAGAVGGAEIVVLDSFTRASGLPDAFARRQARNTQLVLMEEAGLGQVDDPASGAWFLDARTRDLAEAGWAEFQRIQSEGGLIASLEAGTLQARIAQARDARAAEYAAGAAQIVGVTKFVDPDPRPTQVSAEPAALVVTQTITPLSPVRLAASFEEAAR